MDKFETLNDETAILMLDQDVFTVARLETIIANKLCKQLCIRSKTDQTIVDLFYQDLDVFNNEEVKISLNNFQLRFPPEGLECKLLNCQTKEWETGRLRVCGNVEVTFPNTVQITLLTLEFAPEQPTFEYESPLDEIRNSFS